MTTIESYRRRITTMMQSHQLPVQQIELYPYDQRHAQATIADNPPALLAIPPFTNSAMDGFAVRADDCTAGITLPVSGDIPAGTVAPSALAPGTAMRIMTGAPLPDGADSVVRVEDTDHGAGISTSPATVTISVRPGRGDNVRYAGEAMQLGERLALRSTRLDAAAASLLVSAGYATVSVRPAPRVAVITTGTELQEPGAACLRGQIPDSNRVLLAGLLHEADAQLAFHVTAADDPEEFHQHLRSACAAHGSPDLLLTSGGLSKGAYEVVRQALPELAYAYLPQQPGGPQGYGEVHLGYTASDTTIPVIALPGNPVSAFISFQLYVRPALAVLRGVDASAALLSSTGILTVAWPGKPNNTQVVPVRRDANGAYTPTFARRVASYRLDSLLGCDACALIPPGNGVEKGTPVTLVHTR